MDYFGVVREAWDVIKRERGLWGLAAIELVHYLLLMLLALLTSVPVVMLAAAAASQQRLAVSSVIDTATFWFASHYTALLILLGVVFVAYATAAVLSVAAQAGIVDQAARSLRGGVVVAGDGLGVGFRLWWRAASILALPALPALLYYLALAIVMQAMVAAPLSTGARPDLAGVNTAIGLLSPVSTMVGVLGIPLGVLAILALRFGVIRDLAWRDAFREAWRFAKVHFTHVALLYLVLLLVILLATFASEFVFGMLSAVFLGAALVVGMNVGKAVGIAIGVVGGILVVAAFCAFLAVLSLVNSVSWTVMYVRLNEPIPQSMAEEAS